MTNKAVVVISGGLDSTTLLHHIVAQGWDCMGISFNYGQRHAKELSFAEFQCNALGVEWDHVDLAGVGDLFARSGSKSSLVSDEDVPEGHYGEESMKATIVPNRNMIMLAIATGVAVSAGAEMIATGVHAGDHFIYPDCRPEFLSEMDRVIKTANDDRALFINAPFLTWSKNDIAQRAFDLNVDIGHTWSCYKGGDLHCGKCGTCVERLEAINSTGNTDPTMYADDTFWREAIKRDTV